MSYKSLHDMQLYRRVLGYETVGIEEIRLFKLIYDNYGSLSMEECGTCKYFAQTDEFGDGDCSIDETILPENYSNWCGDWRAG